MTLNKYLILVFLFFSAAYISVYAQTNPAIKKNSTKSLHDVAVDHRQLYDMSCIPMTIEMVLKYNNRVAPDFYDLQNNWQNKADGTFQNFDGKVIGGLKLKHQFNVQRGDNFPFAKLFKTIDSELAAGRKVIISLPSGFNFWHMYVIDRKMDKDDYLAYSRFYNSNELLTKEHVKSWIYGCKGTDILTYKSIN